MSRAALDALIRTLEAAYRGDRFSALRVNLEDIRPEEWHAHPTKHDVAVFGEDPELSIAEIVAHVGAGKRMYANHGFGDRSLQWGPSAGPPAWDMPAVLDWLDEGHRNFVACVDALGDDSELAVERYAPWGALLPTEHLIAIIRDHDLYHSGEVNRQRSLMRGAEGWTMGRVE